MGTNFGRRRFSSHSAAARTRRTRRLTALLLSLCALNVAQPIAQAQGGSVVAWGSNTYGKTNVPPSATNVVAVSGGSEHSLALCADGTLVGWGSNSYGQTNVPAAATNLAAVSAGGSHNLALRRDGTVIAWGSPATGQTNVPPAAAGAVAVAAAFGRSVALHADGSVVGWGGVGPATNVPSRVSDLTRISGATAQQASGFCVGLRRDGTVVAWGSGALSMTNVPAAVTNAVAVAAGGRHGLALLSRGAVVAWGWGAGTNVPASATNVVAVTAGEVHSLALRTDGTVIAWGDNSSRQASVPTGLVNVIAIDAGSTHSLALVGDGSPRFTDIARPVRGYAGRPLTLNAMAVGAPPLSYQWQANGTNLDGAVGPTLTLPDVQFSDAGLYSVVVNNALGVSTGEVATVEVDLPPVPPAITRDPESQTVVAGTNVLFSVEVTGHPLPTFQWQFSGTNLAGATRSNYAVPYVLPAHAGPYRVIASNSSGAATSAVATLTVDLPPWPVVTNWPASRVVSIGAPVTLQVAATGTAPLHYQWRLNGADLGGVTGPSLSFSAVRWADAGVYSVVVSNASGKTTSLDFELIVTPVTVWGTGSVTNLPTSLSNAVAIAAGRGHALALKADGTVVRWGASNVFTGTPPPPGARVTNSLEVPADLDRVVAVACGDHHSLALREDGTVVAWGLNSGGQTNVPAHATNVIAVAAGGAHSLALRADGTVMAWGTNSSGQIVVPSSATNVIAIAAGGSRSVALRNDGSLVFWGAFTAGGSATTNMLAVAEGEGGVVGIQGSSRRLVRLGSYPQSTSATYGIATDPSGVLAVAAGANHCLVLMDGGTVIAFYDSFLSRYDPRLTTPSWLKSPVAVAAGGDFSLALVNESRPCPPLQPIARGGFVGGTTVFNAQGPGATPDAYQWRFAGTNLAGATEPSLVLTNLQAGQTGDYAVVASNPFGAATSRVAHLEVAMPPAPEILQQPASLSVPAGTNALFVVRTALGVPVSYQWQHGGTNLPDAHAYVLWLTNVQAAHSGDYRAILANVSGMVTSELATLNVTSSPPTVLTQPQSVTVAPGLSASYSVTAAGTEPLAYQWRWNETDLPGANSSGLTLPRVDLANAGDYSVVVANVSGAVTSAIARLTVLPVAGWGINYDGQLNIPVSATNLLAVAGGYYHSLGLRADGTVLAWGRNVQGQATVPASGTNIVAVAAGYYHSLALRADGSVLAWGTGSYGENQGPAGLSNVIAISTYYRHNLALKSDGTATAWGYNSNGQCDIPPEATNLIAVAAGESWSLGLRADGTVVGWGFEASYHDLLELTHVTAIAAGRGHSLALRADGTVTGCGQTFDQPAANPPAGLSNVVAIAAGSRLSLALQGDGTVKAWGSSEVAQLEVPAGLTNVLAIAAGEHHGLALVGPPTPQVGTFSEDRTVPAGSTLVIGGAALGSHPLGYEWQRGGQVIARTGEPFLVLPNAQTADSGTYSLVVTNGSGSITGQVSTLTIAPSRPVILSQPASQIVGLGTPVELSVEAIGSALTFQWQHAGTNMIDGGRMSGANTSRLRIAATELTDSGEYVLTLNNSLGQEISSPAVLTVLPPTLEEAVDTTGLVWTTGGDSRWVWQAAVTHDGQDAAVSGPLVDRGTNGIETSVTGPITLGFWWKVSSYSYGGYFRFRLDGRELASIAGEADWQPLSVHVPAGTHTVRWEYAKTSSLTKGQDRAWLDQVGIVDPVAPTILTQPPSRSVSAGSTVLLTVVAQGTLPLTYQWQQDGADLEGGTNATLNLTNVQSSASYSAVVSNVAGTTNSAAASLTVIGSAPTIVTQPSAQTAAISGDATFTCAFRGSEPLSFEWQFEGEDIPGATSPTMILQNVQPGHAGRYRVVAHNASGTTFSVEAPLTLVPVAAWGSASILIPSSSPVYNPTLVPSYVGEVVSLAAGTSSSLALRRDGSVASWGANVRYIPYAYSPTASGLTAISASAGYAVGLRADGTVVAWGGTTHQIPAELTNAIAVAAGGDHSLALRDDGTVIAWGNNDYGQVTVPADATRIVALAGGGNHSLALRNDGTVIAWGSDESGQTEVPIDLTNAVAISAGLNHSLALRDDGTVAAWGGNDFGQANVPAGLADVVAIAAGENHNLALRSDGTAVAWGLSDLGQAEPPAFLTNVVALAGGGGHSLALVGDGQPVVTVQPFSRQAYLHGTTRLRVMAVGAGPLAYQWWRDGEWLTGKTNATLVLANLSAADSGRYRCVIISSRGQTESREAEVSVVAPPLEFDPAGTFPAADGFHLRLMGLLGDGEIVIYSSPDLMTWEPIHTNSPVVGVFECVDRAATNGAQFYRASETRTP